MILVDGRKWSTVCGYIIDIHGKNVRVSKTNAIVQNVSKRKDFPLSKNKTCVALRP